VSRKPRGRRARGALVWLRLLALAAAGAAIVDALRRPAAERTWRGAIAGVVPYDLRPPTPRRLRDALWEPDGPLLKGQAFGVGWTPNLGRLARLLRLA
jgi:hypothetical protein